MTCEVSIQKVNDVWIRVIAEPSIKMDMSEYFTFEVPGAKFSPKVKSGMWDGKIRMLNGMTGMIYLGLKDRVIEFLERRGIEYELDDRLVIDNDIPEDAGHHLAKKFDTLFECRDYQNEAVVAALKNERMLMLSPTSSGKSFIIYLIARYHAARGRKVLLLVDSKSLLKQMGQDNFPNYNKNRELSFGYYNAGEVPEVVEHDMTLCLYQSIAKNVAPWFDQFDVILCDEAHKYKAMSLKNLMEKTTKIRYKIGFTGTIDGAKSNEWTLNGVFGETHQIITTKELMDEGSVSEFDISILTLKYDDSVVRRYRNCKKNKKEKKITYHDESEFLKTLEERDDFLVRLMEARDGVSLLLLKHVEHVETIAEKLTERVDRPVHMIVGKLSSDERESIRQNVNKSKDAIIVATYGTMSTGVDIPSITTLVMGFPYKSRITVLQSIGRALRVTDRGKAKVFDIVDDLTIGRLKNYTLKHLNERVKIYTQEQFDYTFKTVKIKGKDNGQ